MGNFSQIEELYVQFLRASGLRELTIRLYRHNLRQLHKHYPDPLACTVADLVVVLGASNWGAETKKSARTTYRSFFGWALAQGLISDDPAALLPKIKTPAGVSRPIPIEDARQAMTKSDRRIRLMVLCGLTLGLRASEIAAIHTHDLGNDDVLRVCGKGGIIRRVPVQNSELRRAIRSSIGWLFPGNTNGHLSAGRVTKLLSQHLPGKWTAHSLRHRAGTQSYEKTHNILAVSVFLGHSKVETTQRYILMPESDLWEIARATQI